MTRAPTERDVSQTGRRARTLRSPGFVAGDRPDEGPAVASSRSGAQRAERSTRAGFQRADPPMSVVRFSTSPTSPTSPTATPLGSSSVGVLRPPVDWAQPPRFARSDAFTARRFRGLEIPLRTDARRGGLRPSRPSTHATDKRPGAQSEVRMRSSTAPMMALMLGQFQPSASTAGSSNTPSPSASI